MAKGKRKIERLEEDEEREEDLNMVNDKEEEEEEEEEEEDKEAKRKRKIKKRLVVEAAKARRRGICYMSRIPPHMNPCNLRHILSEYGDIERLYLAPKNASAQVRRKPGGHYRNNGEFSEGWIEFTEKKVAKRVANMLNGEQIGGKKRSPMYYDLWNIKYLSKFKWEDLTEEIAFKHAVREQKLALAVSAAKKDKDFYIKKVEKARALSSIEERLKKKQKLQGDSGTGEDIPVAPQAPKVVRKFPQNKTVKRTEVESKSRLSKDILAGVFGGSG